MSGSLTVPVVLGNEPAGNNNLSDFDANYDAITQYVNAREVTVGLLASRPAFGTAGRYYFATNVNGGTFYLDTGTGWTQLGAGVTQPAQNAFVQVLVGCTLSNDGGSPNTILDVAAGGATSDDATLSSRVLMTLAALKGTTAGTWVVGDSQPKLDAGAVANSTWYHVFVIQRVDTGVTDILFSTSPSAPTMPASYTKKRRIGSFKTNASAQILAFVQQGDYFRWLASVLDSTTAWANNTAFTITLASVPTGVNVEWYGNVLLKITGTSSSVLVSDLGANDEAPNAWNAATPSAPGLTVSSPTANQIGAMVGRFRTNTTQQMRGRFNGAGGTELDMVTLGWYDRRGQDS